VTAAGSVSEAKGGRDAGRSVTDLEARLRDVMARGVAVPFPEDPFNALALEVFRHQADKNRVYGAFVRGRGIEPAELADWREIPLVPTRAFKELPLICGDPGEAEAVFRTSGTTRGGDARGTHHVRSLSLYRASLVPNASAYLRPELDGPEARAGASPPVRVLALLPSPDDRPDSSLVHMVGVLAAEWDDGGGGFFADEEWRLRDEALQEALERAMVDGVPVLVAGTAFAFVDWTDRVAEKGGDVVLPPESRIMETGGFKGRSREVSREDLYRAMGKAFGVPPERIVNEYGMTELLSQFWEPVLREGGPADPGARHHVAPPWVRTRVLDPRDLSPVPPGEPGILAHLDLANLHSVAAVLTEDRGVEVEGGFRVLGRTPGAEPRGCSLTMEELLEARGGGASRGAGS
jgi:hypothetical protein